MILEATTATAPVTATAAAVTTTATTAHSSSAGGLFMLAWGLFASGMGLALVTNFRGFADTFARHAQASSSGLRRLPPWKGLQQRPGLAASPLLLRCIAIPFAVLGPIMVVAGIVTIARGHISMPREAPAPMPFGIAVIAIAALSIAQYWRPRGFFRVTARRGGWRRVVVIASSLGTIVFAVSLVLGQMTIGILAWLVCGLPMLALFMDRQPATPEIVTTSEREH